jgi:hypothetical protein
MRQRHKEPITKKLIALFFSYPSLLSANKFRARYLPLGGGVPRKYKPVIFIKEKGNAKAVINNCITSPFRLKARIASKWSAVIRNQTLERPDPERRFKSGI